MINWSTNSPADNEQAFSFTIGPRAHGREWDFHRQTESSIPVLLCGYTCPQIKGLVQAVLTQDEILLDFKGILLVLRLQECRSG